MDFLLTLHPVLNGSVAHPDPDSYRDYREDRAIPINSGWVTGSL